MFDVLIVVYKPVVYLIGIKVNIYLFFFVDQLLFFLMESIHAVYFVNSVVYKFILVREMVVSFFTKFFI